MVFTEQQLQVKKLVDVQQDIEIDALNDGVNRVNSNVVKNSQDISAQYDRISDAETRIGNLETTDTQILNTIDQIQTANGTSSMGSYWLSLMPSERAAEIQRKMISKPETLE